MSKNTPSHDGLLSPDGPLPQDGPQNGRRGPRVQSPWWYESHDQAAMDLVGCGARSKQFGLCSAGRAHNASRECDPGGPGWVCCPVAACSHRCIRMMCKDCFISIHQSQRLCDGTTRGACSPLRTRDQTTAVKHGGGSTSASVSSFAVRRSICPDVRT